MVTTKKLQQIRQCLELAFSPDTSETGEMGTTPSAGHDAVVALIIYDLYGGDLVSANVEGQSHWFNRLVFDDVEEDVDLTADQFGGPKIFKGYAGSLYPNTRVLDLYEVGYGTQRRAKILLNRMVAVMYENSSTES